ncbi:MAG: DUF3786 domain-containing protein [Chloroflexota bacterium]
MKVHSQIQHQDSDTLAQRLEELHTELRKADPWMLADRTGATYLPTGEGVGEFRSYVWGEEVVVNVPEYSAHKAESGEELDPFTQTLLAYYFHTSDGKRPTGQWIAFTELPAGQFYTKAFQGYTGQLLAYTFHNNLESFKQAAKTLGGRKESLGDCSYSFQVLPLVRLMVACWQGDEDFPPSYRILFDESISHHLPTDACAILGSTLSRRMIKAETTSA